jgi:hypothetical protein
MKSLLVKAIGFPATLIHGDTLVWHWFSLIVGLKTLPDKGLTENTKLKEFFPS